MGLSTRTIAVPALAVYALLLGVSAAALWLSMPKAQRSELVSKGKGMLRSALGGQETLPSLVRAAKGRVVKRRRPFTPWIRSVHGSHSDEPN